jgi:hypothetical protein
VLVVGNLAAFTMRHGSELAGRVLGTFSGNLNNSGENFTLLDANGSVIANVTYGIAEPWPVAAQDSGYSLVLDNPAPNTSYAPANFHASAQPGGTPGTAPGPAFTGNPAADTDHDGFSDLLEYATGSSPTHPNSINRPVAGRTNLVTDGVTHPYMTFTYRRSDAADGVAYRVELSTTLGIWSSAPDAVTYVGTSNNGDGTSTITWRATEPIGSTPGQFMRLRVTRQ